MQNENKAVAHYFKYNYSGALSVDWYIGKRCNFDCTYCVDYLHDNVSKHVPLENMKKLVDIIYEREKENVFWSLTGGEPTVNPKFLDLCKYIKEKGARFISVTTNGSRKAEYLCDLYQYLDGITLSFHFEHMQHRIDEYIEKCIKLEDWRRAWNEEQKKNPNFPDHDRGYIPKTLILRFMVYPGQFANMERMEKAFLDHGITNIEHRYIRAPHGGSNELMPTKKLDYSKDNDNMELNQLTDIPTKLKSIVQKQEQFYTAEEKEKIKVRYENKSADKKKLKRWFEEEGELIDRDYHYNELNWDKGNNFLVWQCYAGMKHVKVTPPGDIYIGSCHVGGKRGNIYEKDTIDLPKVPVICPKNRCTDNTDLKVPKIKNEKYYHLIKDMMEWRG